MLGSTPPPEAGAQCVSSARWDLCGGPAPVSVPTAMPSIRQLVFEPDGKSAFTACAAPAVPPAPPSHPLGPPPRPAPPRLRGRATGRIRDAHVPPHAAEKVGL